MQMQWGGNSVGPTCKHGCHINGFIKSSIDQDDEHINVVVIQSAVRQMENNIRVNNDQMVSHSLPDTPFSLISPLALSNHLILGIPLFRTFSSSFFLRSALLFSPYARTSSASYLGRPLRFLPLSVPQSRIFHSLSCRPL